MKQLLYIIAAVSFSCTAQTILPLYGGEYPLNDTYYKDLENDLQKYTGTWKYSNGTTSLTITLIKKEMQLVTSGTKTFYEDFVSGEYKYVENGLEKINTLSNFDNSVDAESHSISGNILYGSNRNLQLDFIDPNIDIMGMTGGMFFERADSNGQQKLKLSFRMTDGPITVQGQPLGHTQYTVPFGEYILIKQ